VDHTLYLNMTAKASASFVSLDYWAMREGSGTNATWTVGSAGAGSITGASAISAGNFTYCGSGSGSPCVASTATVGTNFTVFFELSVTAHTVDSVAIHIDNVFLKGADAVVSGANLFLIDFASNQWFNVTDYPGTTVGINYSAPVTCSSFGFTQSSPTYCTLLDPPEPDLAIQLTDAKLITVSLGGPIPYARTLLVPPNLLDPAVPTSVDFYLDAPSVGGIFAYTLTVNDLTKTFLPQTTQVFILSGTTVITSAVLDAKSQFGMTMKPGVYGITLETASATYTSTLSLTASDNAPAVLIQTANQAISVGPMAQFSYTLGWDCDGGGITSSLTDQLGTMSSITVTLYRYNVTFPTGTSLASSTSAIIPSPGTPITSTHDFRNSTIAGLNSSTPGDYMVGFSVTVNAVIENVGIYPVVGGVSACPNTFPNPAGASGGFVIPAAILGLDQVLSGPAAWEEILALTISVASVGIIGARLAHIGLLVLGGEMGLFFLMGWLPIAAGFVSLVLFIGSIGMLVNRSRRPIT
jgi:hypothetical protein